VDRRVLADRGVRATTGLDADDALGRQRLVAHQELRVFGGVDVVGHHGDVVAIAQCQAQRERERGLAGADRAADADAKGLGVHERNSLVYCVSCRLLAIASPGVKLLHPCSGSVGARSASRGIDSPSAASSRWPALCPSGTAFTAAITWFSTHAHR